MSMDYENRIKFEYKKSKYFYTMDPCDEDGMRVYYSNRNDVMDNMKYIVYCYNTANKKTIRLGGYYTLLQCIYLKQLKFFNCKRVEGSYVPDVDFQSEDFKEKVQFAKDNIQTLEKSKSKIQIYIGRVLDYKSASQQNLLPFSLLFLATLFALLYLSTIKANRYSLIFGGILSFLAFIPVLICLINIKKYKKIPVVYAELSSLYIYWEPMYSEPVLKSKGQCLLEYNGNIYYVELISTTLLHFTKHLVGCKIPIRILKDGIVIIQYADLIPKLI